MPEILKIEIGWDGPYKKGDILKDSNDTKTDFGLYQIYGTHLISGPNSLLYIGKASEQTFATRLRQHDWTDWEASETDFYLGRLGGEGNVKDEDTWRKLIDIAERMLIYFSAPPYNTQNLISYGEVNEDVVVLNFGKKNRLPLEVSTMYETSDYWNKEKWKPYTE